MDHMMRLAVAQPPAELTGRDARLDWLSSMLPTVADQKADLLLLPELFTCGYNIGEGVVTCAEPQDGPTARAIQSLAREFNIAIHYGFSEADTATIYNAAQCFAPDGTRLGGHRKLAIPPGFEQTFFAQGTGCETFLYKGFKVGTLICYDAEFPETARHVAALGADVILVPTALGAKWDWVAKTMIPTRAFENGVYLAYANSAGCEGELEFLGQSFIAAPDGQILTRADESPQILFADLQKSKVQKAQARLPYLMQRTTLNL